MRLPIPIFLVLCVFFVHNKETQQQIKLKIIQQQRQIHNQIGIKYGKNTETLTFLVTNMTDFVLKPFENQEIKGTLQVYWDDNNNYVHSTYRKGQNIKMLILDENQHILYNYKFYTTYGFKFPLQKQKTYTIRLINEGSVIKIIRMEISKLTQNLKNIASRQHTQRFGRRLQSISQQIKVLLGISQFSIILHEKQTNQMNKNSSIYMSYLMIQAGVVIVIVAFQVKILLKMLSSNYIV